MATASHRTVEFTVEGQSPETFAVSRFEGEERLCRPYWFDLDLIADAATIELHDMVGHKAQITMAVPGRDEPRLIHGVVTRFLYVSEAPDGRHRYSARLEPRLALLAKRRRNQIFAVSGPETVVAIIEAQLRGGSGSSSGVKDMGADILGPEDYSFKTLTADYPAREHVVQFEESDLDFVHRTLEHHGIFYYFEQTDSHEKVIFCDDNVNFAPWLYAKDDETGPYKLPYRPASGMGSAAEPAVLSVSAGVDVVPRTVRLTDYNYRMPHVPLVAETTVDERGVGAVERYGDHFFTPEFGAHLARVRRQAILTDKVTFRGETTLPTFQPGHLYELIQHPRTQFNLRHLIVSVHHIGERKIFGNSGIGDSGGDGDASRATEYRNSYSAIPSHITYRPPMTTPVPRLHGVMHGFVDGTSNDNRADIDAEGRYKIKIPFDPVGRKDAEASRYIRMAQPYGGDGHGMHMPLVRNTEILWTCINGDLDRPIICGVVPNPLQKSVVTSKNRTSNIIRTVSGIEMEFNDGPGAAPAGQVPAPAAGRLAAQKQAQDFTPGVPRGSFSMPLSDTSPSPDALSLPASRHYSAAGPAPSDARQSNATGEKWYRVSVPQYKDGKGISYLRMGAPDPALESDKGDDLTSVKTSVFKKYDEDGAESGWLDYTTGSRFSYTEKDSFIVIHGDLSTKVTNSGETVTEKGVVTLKSGAKHEYKYVKANSSDYKIGQDISYFLGTKVDGKLGLFADTSLAAKLDVAAGISTGIKLSVGAEIGYQKKFEYVKGESEKISKSHSVIAQNSIKLVVDETATDAASALLTPSRLLGAGLATTVSAAAGAIEGLWDSGEKEYALGQTETFAAAAAAAAGSVAAIAAAKSAANAAANLNKKSPQIEISKKGVLIISDNYNLMLHKTKTVLGNKLIAKSYLEISDDYISIIFSGSKIKIDSDGVTIKSESVTVNGDLKVSGKLSVTKTIDANDSISTNASIKGQNIKA